MAVTLPALADKAGTFYTKGKDAEARENYEEAYDLYKQAFDLNPKDLKYKSAYERLRFLAGASHVHRGQLLQDTGKLDEALAEFQKAAEVDPSSPIAVQEIKHTQRMIEEAKFPKPQSSVRPNSLDRRLAQAQGPVQLANISNVPITLKLAPEDTKMIYETIGKLAGINVLFDPEYTSRSIKIELNGVTLQEALRIVALESKTFWRPVTPNTIFVAADNPAKRKELEQSVIKTFYMANMSQPTELQDVVNAMRQILEITRIQPLPSQDAIVIRGTPDQITLAQKLVDDLDKAKPEVVVDIAIMQVSRDKVRNLGINPPTSATVALQNNINTTSTTGTTTTTGTTDTSSSTGTPNQVNLNRIGNLNATDFTVTIPSATATAMFSDSTVRLLQNPQIRSVNGQKASLKIGEKLPVATGSFQPGIGGVGINPLVNTQFTYLDVGVNIDITPTIHANREVTLKVSLDVSSQTSTVNIGGITQPVIGQRKIEHEIRLKEGEASLLGGMLEDQNTRSLSGIPGLAQIPILKYLFSQTNTEHSENEVVFVLIPHIVRAVDLDDINDKAIDVGTATSIQLNPVSESNVPAQPATTQSGGVGAAPAPVQTPAPATENPSAQPANAAFAFDPPTVNATKGSTFAINVMLNGAQNVYAVPLQVSYDPKLLQIVNVSNGGFLSQDGQAVALMHRGEDDGNGVLQINASRPPGASGLSGQGSVVTLTFMAKGSGQAPLTISKGGARDPAMQAIPVAGAVATVNVQ
ncbi:MAG TPA: cohesin domain-containing protein [Terriglobales bacterium]